MKSITSRTVVLFVVTILFVAATLVGGYVGYAPFTRMVDGLYVALQMPADLRGAYLFENRGSYESYHVGTLGLVATPERDFFMPAGSVSPDGTRVVYAYASTTDNAASFLSGLSIRPSAWTIVTRPIDGTDLTFVANGYAPAFLDDSHIAFFSDGGIVVVDTAANTQKVLFTRASGPIDSFVRYSPDRTKVFWSIPGSKEGIVGEISPSSFKVTSSFEVEYPVQFLLTDTALYETRFNRGNVEIWQKDQTGAVVRRAVTIPGSLQIKSLLL